ncbi:DsrE/DsrF/TusD sulfur relay family protein [Companilactobacillus mishanensis]|uniref:DsrE family protein n=1 Tax=Companilactobacillus mishanensis TaxID=2486008 RepID=A0A5P0ZFH5_9LACO|nr:DsrE family protein [Companilactobacillus mishanensis]MQS45937.1 DsrE family protein [Companilactobacillus mishanensis]MQS51800.1 DsrE family protein [Companilactobacillus mishanensis]MQS89083.1 DsrE family protein [Companilactobacillus mishanensis]
MKIGIVLETKEHEKAWNALRFAITSLGKGHEVRIFLMGEGVEIEDIKDDKFDVTNKMHDFTENGGKLLACGTCIMSRHREDTTTCPISTMVDCVEMVEWADKTVTF